MRRWLAPLLCALALAAMASRSAAAVPSPTNSSTPACLAPCPMGDASFLVVVRDLANNPVGGSTVVIDLSQCPGAFICDGLGSDPYITDKPNRMLHATTDASGTIEFHPRLGGTGAPGSVRVYADGVLLHAYALASPDQSGNGLVVSIIDPDDAIFAAKLGTSDPTADFDCDGTVNLTDQQYFFSHHSHSCVGFVDPAKRGTWGSLKAHYR